MRDRLAYIFAALLLFAAGCFRAAPVSEPTSGPTVRTAKLIFIGDVMSHSPQVAAARAAAFTDTTHRDADYDYSGVFRYFKPIFDSADIVVANLETTLRTSPPYTGYPSFSAPFDLAFAMREAGVDIVTTANNHICDKGAGGIRSTLALLDSAGLAHTGAFADSAGRHARNPLKFTAGGLRFVLLGYTYGTNGIPVPDRFSVNMMDTTLIARDLAATRHDPAASPTDCVIVCYHWGEEYRQHPAAAQKQLAAWTRSRGADLIIGGHPHVVQPPEAHYNADSTAVTGATWYSLGNFVSNQRRRYTDGGMAAEITVTRIADSLPVGFEFAYRLFWVDDHYTVLPSSVADTMIRDPRYDLFIGDTRKLFSAVDTVFTRL